MYSLKTASGRNRGVRIVTCCDNSVRTASLIARVTLRCASSDWMSRPLIPGVSYSSRRGEACAVDELGSAYRRGRGVSTNRRHEPIHVYVSWCAEDWARPTFRNRTVVLPGPRAVSYTH